MPGRTIAMANLKGGVGKTTTCLMLAEGLSLRVHDGKPNKVLVVDLDAQANASLSLLGMDNLVRAGHARRTIDVFILRQLFHDTPAVIEDFITPGMSHVYGNLGGRPRKSHIDLLACYPDFMTSERQLLIRLAREGNGYQQVVAMVCAFMRHTIVEPARNLYDWVVFDCAPGINMFNQAAIGACDATVIVTVPEPLPYFGMDTFLGALSHPDAIATGFAPPGKQLVLLNRVVPAQVSHQAYCDRLATPPGPNPAFRLLNTRIPEAASLHKDSYLTHAVQSLSVRYPRPLHLRVAELAQEIEERVVARHP